jgi:excisionase family DNA binding protein
MSERLSLRPAEAAKALGISVRTLWTLTKSGKIPALCLGQGPRKTYLYSTRALEAWLDGTSTKEG